MRISPVFAFAVSLGLSSTAAASEVLSEQQSFVVQEMHARGDDIIVMMDKNRAELMVVDQGKVIMETPALYGRGSGEDEKRDSATTPAGVFALREYRIDPKEYEGGLGLAFLCNSKSCYMIHPVWNGDATEKRNERLATPAPDDNAISRGGCINVSVESYKRISDYLYIHRKITAGQDGRKVMSIPRLVVLPKDENLQKTAEILFKPS